LEYTNTGKLTEILDGTLTEPESNTDLDDPENFDELHKHAKDWGKDGPKANTEKVVHQKP